MKKILFLYLILLLFSSCMSVSTGYFAKEPDFFLYPEQAILFTANIGDLQQNAQFEEILSTFFINNRYDKSYSLIKIDPLGVISDLPTLLDYLKKYDIQYIISVTLTNSETDYDYVPQTVHTDVYNFGGYVSANSYSTGGYYTSSTVKTFAVTVSDTNGNRYALFEVKSDDSLNLFDGDKELFEKIAQNIFENLTPQPETDEKH
ncbi:MAG: hypothetical protein PUI38_04930 [Candidatus Treponema excrementipullorum]|nr:hypothetical protein [Spirochaetia bacterium]MDD7012183.1 hypothetical protein [Candidatus Treponema excrementipullorum]MDY4707038.1 hypothetical protein [Candidatus Treponema excrementipullorum]